MAGNAFNQGTNNAIVVKSYFAQYDKDNSGSVNVNELKNLVYDLGFFPDAAEIGAIHRSLDKDKSGSINFEEFFAWWKSNERMQKLDIANNPTLKAAVDYFRRIDTDGTGKIGLAEYKQLCAELGRSGLSDKDAAAGLIALDKNKDGQIDFNEFVDWLRWDK